MSTTSSPSARPTTMLSLSMAFTAPDLGWIPLVGPRGRWQSIPSVVKISEMKALEILLRCHHCSCSIHLVFLAILYGNKNPLCLPFVAGTEKGLNRTMQRGIWAWRTAFIHAFLEEPSQTPPQTRSGALVRLLWFLIFSFGVLLTNTCQGFGTKGGQIQDEEACLVYLCPRAWDSIWHRADYQ